MPPLIFPTHNTLYGTFHPDQTHRPRPNGHLRAHHFRQSLAATADLFRLIIAQVIYACKFLKSLWYLISNFGIMDDNTVMIAVLYLIDVVMIANLLTMVIVGGYETFVSRLHVDEHPDQPEWLSHVNASVLKVKLSMSIISISSIHLLQTFLNADNLSEKQIMWQCITHICFLISALAMALTDKIVYSTTHKTH